MEIVALAVDMKVPKEGPGQIIEVMPAHIAGSFGYRALYGETMLDAHIVPILKKKFPHLPVAIMPAYSGVAELGDDYGAEVAERGKGIIFPQAVHRPRRYSRSDLRAARANPDVIVANADQGLLNILDNKAAVALIAREHKAMSPHFALTAILPTNYHDDMANSIRAEIGPHELYVIKPVDQIQGNGVRIIPDRRLRESLEMLLVGKRDRRQQKKGRDYWESDINPVFVAQPYIPSVPVQYKGSGTYDGTMRVFMVLDRGHPSDPFSIQICDAYWKLPPNSLSAPMRPASLVSQSARDEDQTLPKRLRDAWNILLKGRGANDAKSARVDEEIKERVFTGLRHVMPDFTAAVMGRPLTEHIQRWLYDDDPSVQYTGAMVAAHPRYFVASLDDPLHRNAKRFPEEYFTRMWSLATGASNPEFCNMQDGDKVFEAHYQHYLRSPLYQYLLNSWSQNADEVEICAPGLPLRVHQKLREINEQEQPEFVPVIA